MIKNGVLNSIPAFGPITAITIYDNYVLAVCSDFTILLISTDDMKLTRVEGKIFSNMRTNPIFALSREKDDKVFGFSSNLQVIFSLKESISKKSFKASNMTVCCKEQGTLGFDHFGNNKLLLVQRQWGAILSNMPAPLDRHRFGT